MDELRSDNSSINTNSQGQGDREGKMMPKLTDEQIEAMEDMSDEEKKEYMDELKEDADDKYSVDNTLKAKYRTTLESKYSSKISSLSDEKLETISTKIDTFLEKIESSSYSDSKKEAYFATLLALKDIINDQLNDTDELDIDSIFN